MKKIKICIIITDPINLFSLYRDQFKYLENNGFDVTAIASNGKEHKLLNDEGIKTKAIFMKKQPSPLIDFISLIKLIWFLIFNRYDIISVSTPKASLLGALAAYLTFHKHIIYTLRGRAYEHKKGLSLKFYHTIEKLVSAMSQKVFCISHELKQDFIEKKLCPEDKIFVIGKGSSNGVDLNRFTKNTLLVNQATQLRDELGITKSDIVILSSGRMRKDKGINELVYAFDKINRSDVHLVLQGKFEKIDLLDKEVLNIIDRHKRIYIFPWEQDIEKYFQMADIFAFPTHREGFGNVALEASAMEKPVLTFNVMGVRESVENNVSGILVNHIGIEEYYKGLLKLINNKGLRVTLGSNGRKRVEDNFNSLLIWEELVKVYNDMLKI